MMRWRSKADLGVAMYAGATVSRRVADIILLNNSFTSLPIGMKLGNRIMQAIEIIATLFFLRYLWRGAARWYAAAWHGISVRAPSYYLHEYFLGDAANAYVDAVSFYLGTG